MPGATRATSTAPSPTTPRRSGSSRNTRRLQQPRPRLARRAGYYNRGVAWRARATSTAPSPTTTRRSGSIRKRRPTTTAAGRTLLALCDIQQALSRLRRQLRLTTATTQLTMGSRGFVYFRLNRLDNSIANYDASLKINSGNAYSLYGRGIAKLLQRRHCCWQRRYYGCEGSTGDLAEEVREV